jgi:hypothetical protein
VWWWRHWRTTKSALKNALNVLSRAGTVAFGGVGFAGVTLPETAAFREVEEAGSEVRPDVEKLLRHGTPAGRVYAATLLDEIDRSAGRDAWQHLARQDGDFTRADGCVFKRWQLSEYASQQLAAP